MTTFDPVSNPSLVLLTAEQYRAMFNLRPGVDRVQRARGKGPPYIRMAGGTAGRVYYRLSDLLEWMKTHTARSTAEERARDLRADG